MVAPPCARRPPPKGRQRRPHLQIVEGAQLVGSPELLGGDQHVGGLDVAAATWTGAQGTGARAPYVMAKQGADAAWHTNSTASRRCGHMDRREASLQGKAVPVPVAEVAPAVDVIVGDDELFDDMEALAVAQHLLAQHGQVAPATLHDDRLPTNHACRRSGSQNRKRKWLADSEKEGSRCDKDRARSRETCGGQHGE